MSKKTFLTVTALSLTLVTATASAATYTVVDLALPSGYSYPAAANSIAGGQVGGSAYSSGTRAMLWNDIYSVGVDITPTDYTSGWVNGTTGSQQIGTAKTGGNYHALLWNGSAGDYTDLHSTDYDNTYGLGIGGGQQVGSSDDYALLWTGSAGSVVNLHPADLFTYSAAWGTNGNYQVGYGYNDQYAGDAHALLWHGIAASRIDLNPDEYEASYGNGISGNQIVGDGYPVGDDDHALLWTIDNDGNVVDFEVLHPDGFSYSTAWGTNGTQQVGVGDDHAILWNGANDDYIDLHQFLDPSYTYSVAYGIDANGNIAGLAIDGEGNRHAVVWVVPEPTSALLLMVGGIMAAIRRRRRIG